MLNEDRSTKLLLTLLVVGVWGLIVVTFFAGQPVEAQH